MAVPLVCIEGAVFDQVLGRCRCKNLTHYEEESDGVKYCRSCKDGSSVDPERASCQFCTFKDANGGKIQTCLTEPFSYLARDDLDNHNRFEFGSVCMGYSSQEILFVMPTQEGWAEITQSSKIN